ncbi:MAG: hypothetical protein JOZ13_17440 [Alphaproteobacteria bacterium]|nr:hypothetical protein [Alphaproteobacteria bacterium]
MAPRRGKPGANRWLIVIALLLVLIAVTVGTIYLLLYREAPNPHEASERSDAERIVELCAGGLSDQVTSEVEAGLTDYMSHVHAKTKVGRNTLGAVIKKITAGHSGNDIFRQYQECVKTQTIMHLWPNGHVPPEYLPTIQAAYSEEDRHADALTVHQSLLDHGTYTTRILQPAEGNNQATVTADSIEVIDTEVPEARDPSGIPEPPRIYSYHAALHDLSPATIVEHNEGQPVVRVSCISGDCIAVTQEISTGKGIATPYGPPAYWESMILRFDYDSSDQGKLALLEFRRALARLVSPTHSDKEVCEAISRDPSAPHCNQQPLQAG